MKISVKPKLPMRLGEMGTFAVLILINFESRLGWVKGLISALTPCHNLKPQFVAEIAKVEDEIII